jgi:hypothetical protein
VKIVVCLHAAPPGSDPIGRNDRQAIRLARALAGDNQVSAVLAGTKDEAAALEAALAAGVSHAVRVAGESFAASDFHTLGQVLASALRTFEPDVVLLGAHADTEGLGALSASVARHLGLPHLANIETLALPASGSAVGPAPSVEVTVRGGGRKRRLAVTLPVVMSVVAAAPTGGDAAAGATPPNGHDPAAAIEILALADPDVTVIRRRTEILGGSVAAARPTETVGSAIDLLTPLLGAPRPPKTG